MDNVLNSLDFILLGWSEAEERHDQKGLKSPPNCMVREQDWARRLVATVKKIEQGGWRRWDKCEIYGGGTVNETWGAEWT